MTSPFSNDLIFISPTTGRLSRESVITSVFRRGERRRWWYPSWLQHGASQQTLSLRRSLLVLLIPGRALTRRAFKLADISDVLQEGCGFTVGLGLGVVALLAQRRKQARVRRHQTRIRGTQGGYLLLLRVDHALLVRQRRRHLLLFAT